ncbi:DUF1028 domain-containing protein [Nocardiopsis nanhaiensis]
MYAGTFSIVAYDSATGTCGVAVSSRMPAIGALSVFAHAEAGAVATQALINPLLGVDALKLLRSHPAEDALGRVLGADPDADSRQVAVVDGNGRAAAHTGAQTHPWSGHRTGNGYAVAGNILTGAATLDAMAERWESAGESRAEATLGERLLSALEAGQAAGGDRRGRQSAALYVHTGNPYPYLDLRVDEHHDPVAELRRVHGVAERELLPFVEALPTRENPVGAFDRLLDTGQH